MSVSLVKGQKVNLTKEAGGSISKMLVGLGWDAKDPNVAGAEFDLDVSMFALGANDQVLSDEWFIFWGHKNSPGDAIVHTGDNLTGDGDGDDEQIIVDPSKLPDQAQKLVVAVTIYEADKRGQNFGNVNKAYVRAETDGTEQAKYELDFEAALSSCVVFCEFVRRDGNWHFSANSAEFPGGLKGLCAKYGISATE